MTGVPPDPPSRRLSVLVSGEVQGVGFRWWTRRVARELGLVGFAQNLPDGRVRVVAEGPEGVLRQLVVALSSGVTPGHVTRTETQFDEALGNMSEFRAI